MTLTWILVRRGHRAGRKRGGRALRVVQALASDLREAEHVLDVRTLAHRPVVSALSAPARAALSRLRTKIWPGSPLTAASRRSSPRGGEPRGG